MQFACIRTVLLKAPGAGLLHFPPAFLFAHKEVEHESGTLWETDVLKGALAHLHCFAVYLLHCSHKNTLQSRPLAVGKASVM